MYESGSAGAGTRETYERRLRDVSALLDTLNADVLLLQDIPDLGTAERLASLLKTGRYRVLACSQFDDALPPASQVAILSRQPAMKAGAERWVTPGPNAPGTGFAFANLRTRSGELAVYCVKLPDNPATAESARDFATSIQSREAATRQLLAHVQATARSATNGPLPVVLGGSLNTSPDQSQFSREPTLGLLEEAGFTNAFTGLPLKGRITRPATGRRPDATLDYLFARHASPRSVPTITATRLGGRLPVTVDYQLPSPPSALMASPAETLPAPVPTGFHIPRWVWIGLLGGLALGGVLAWQIHPWLLRRSPTPNPASTRPENRRPPTSPQDTPAQRVSPESVTVAETTTTNSEAAYWQERALAAEQQARQAIQYARNEIAPHLAHLLKDEAVAHLLAQRQEAAQTQTAGTTALAHFEDRLTSIQTRNEQRVELYEKRISQLESELAAKEEVNRHLLAAKIEGAREALRLVKADTRPTPHRLDEVDSKIRIAEEAMVEALREARAKIDNEPSVRFSALMAHRLTRTPGPDQPPPSRPEA